MGFSFGVTGCEFDHRNISTIKVGLRKKMSYGFPLHESFISVFIFLPTEYKQFFQDKYLFCQDTQKFL